MITYLQQHLDERDSLTSAATELAEKAASEGRDLTDTEADSLKSWQTRCAKIDAELGELNQSLESTRRYAVLRGEFEKRSADDDGAGPLQTQRPQVETRTVGQQFVESPNFQSYTGHGQSQRFDVADYMGFEARAAITTANLAIPHFVLPPVVPTTTAPLLEVCGRVTVSSGVVDWVEMGGDPTAAVVAEGSAKPEATITATAKTSSLDTIAHWVQITRQALDDASYIRSVIEGKLRRGIINKAEADMAAAIDASTGVQTATEADLLAAIRVGIGKVEAAGYRPNAVALNPADFAELDIAVMGATVSGPIQQQSFWGMRAVAAGAIPAGKAYVGDFQAGATLFDRGVSSVFVTDSHASLFISNILVILAEARLKSAVTEPLALCECTGTP